MGTDDAAGLATLLAAAEAVDEFGEHYDEDDVREHFMADTIDLEHDTRVAVRDGTIVACGAVVGQVVMREVHTVWCSGVVDPGHRRQGIGRELLTWQLARAEELHRARFGGARRHSASTSASTTRVAGRSPASSNSNPCATGSR